MVEESDPHNFPFDFVTTVFTVELLNYYDDVPQILCDENANESSKRILRCDNLPGCTVLFPLTSYGRFLVYKLIFIYLLKKHSVVYVAPRFNAASTRGPSGPSGPYIYSVHSVSFYLLYLIRPLLLTRLSDICFSSRLIICELFVWGCLFYLTTTLYQFFALLRCVGGRLCGLRKFDNPADRKRQPSVVT